MRIAFVTDKSAPQFVGGYETRVYELATRLAKHHDVRVFTSLATRSATAGRVRFDRVCPIAFQKGKSGGRSLVHSTLFGVSLAWNRLADFRPDATIVEAIPYVHLATMAHWARETDSVLLLDVLEAWGQFRYTRRPILGKLSAVTIHQCLAMGLTWADAVLAISTPTAASLVQNYGLDPSVISIVPLGLPDAEQANTLGEPSEKEFDFVTVSRLVPSKRVADLLKALALLRKSRGWTGKAAIIGSGPLKSALEQEASLLGLDGQVVFTGFVSDEEKKSILRRAKVFVLPSEREGFSLATLEAMRYSLPAVVAQPVFGEVFGTSEFVLDGVNGFYYPVGDVGALADILSRTVTQKKTYELLSESARETTERYTWKTAAEQLEGIIRATIDTVVAEGGSGRDNS